MPSLFSRARTNSIPGKKSSLGTAHDEFGRVKSRDSGNGPSLTFAGRKDKDKKKDQKSRKRTISSPKPDNEVANVFAQIPDGSFLPLSLDRPRDESGEVKTLEYDYGYLSYERHVILGLDEVARLVDVVANELTTRCLTTPFIFSALALDISSPAIKRLIRTFLDTCSNPPSMDADRRWREEARFAGAHELGMCIRWGLARVVRVVGNQAVRGLISWEHYTEFRDSEAAHGYPPAHFSAFFPPLPSVLQSILSTLLDLLTRFIAHSSSSGHTPPTLSPLFGPLLFGLGPASLAFHHTYIHYLRAVNAMEHILLAYVRWQDAPRLASSPTHINTNVVHGSATSLGVPTRLKDWIRGYPSMLPFLHAKDKQGRPQVRRGARTIRVVSVRRNVRMYSPDLVKTAASWGSRPRSSSESHTGLAGSKEWERIAPSALKLQPRYSEGYKKRMDMPPNFHPFTALSSDLSSAASSTSSNTSPLDDKDSLGLGLGLGPREREDRFKTLTDMKWVEFETTGFGSFEVDDKKLQFDLTESEKAPRSEKRQTMNWNDFSVAGFSRSDGPLDTSLQFSPPVTHTITSWPAHNADITKKLKKTQRALPPFGWDTEPVMGSEEVIEEAFLDVFCDLVYGGGWMDVERVEETDRECNWALVSDSEVPRCKIEFKSLPVHKPAVVPGTDPRVATMVVLFEEFVPLEYRQQLAKDSGTKRRLPFFFASIKSKQWKPAPTLNGRPYVVGHVPKSPSYREVEFEGLLRSNGSKVLTLSKPVPPAASLLAPPSPTFVRPRPKTPRTSAYDSAAPPPPEKEKHLQRVPSDSPLTPTSNRRSRFRIPVPNPTVVRRSGLVPAEYSTVDFETRLASYSDDEWNETASTKALTPAEKYERRMSRDDAWVDILVASQNRRLGTQEAEKKGGGGTLLRGMKGGGRSDPELASQEVAQVLAGVRARSPLSDDEGIQTRQLTPEPPHAKENESKGASPVPHGDDNGNIHEDADIDSVMSYPKAKRIGYFDLHPERLPGATTRPLPVRPRANGDESDGDDVPDEMVYGAPEQVPAISPSPQAMRSSFESASEYAPTSVGPSPRDMDFPEFGIGEESREQKESGHSRAESITLPHVQPELPVTPVSQSKTAALIEMYREREKQVTVTTPSRIPIQIPPKDASLPPLPRATSPTPSPQPVPQIEIEEVGVEEPELEEEPLTPNVLYEEAGSNSPGRYVHGMPLQNVLEEDEELDE
ncbi:hypothetical protein M404DRAFT_956908 [Pisolithus tinctorius Marx 270]|uniref:Meiotically up-regulated protein Msb1/Mug8 domain-containing protein n=1 Tax=Pisolithus tinctorius Marx 270 TaxID=870435 RepID=A0A0C3JYN2_PISTI|nr:hypothetical protein M404DRAFT_956908 [Pisolithus tinctorius Marx 270]